MGTKTIHAEFVVDALTKNTVRFVENSFDPVFGYLYIKKSEMPNGTPQILKLTVTIETL
jgi:hypothetical protein